MMTRIPDGLSANKKVRMCFGISGRYLGSASRKLITLESSRVSEREALRTGS